MCHYTRINVNFIELVFFHKIYVTGSNYKWLCLPVSQKWVSQIWYFTVCTVNWWHAYFQFRQKHFKILFLYCWNISVTICFSVVDKSIQLVFFTWLSQDKVPQTTVFSIPIKICGSEAKFFWRREWYCCILYQLLLVNIYWLIHNIVPDRLYLKVHK